MNKSKRILKLEKALYEARRLFRLHGFEKTSIRDIAKSCGCTQGNIYTYFESKEDILYQVLLSEITSLVEAIQPLENDLTIEPVQQLKILIERHVKHTLGPPKGEIVHFEIETHHLSSVHQEEIIRLRDTYDRITRKILRRGMEAGVFNNVNEKLVNYAIASLIIRATLWYSPNGELSLAKLANGISDIFLNGLLSRNEASGEVNVVGKEWRTVT